MVFQIPQSYYFFWPNHHFRRPRCVCQEDYKGDYVLNFYIDDILLAKNKIETIKTTKKWLYFIFEMKGMIEASMY